MKTVSHIEFISNNDLYGSVQKPFLVTEWAHDAYFAYWVSENPAQSGPVDFIVSLWVS